MVDSTKGMSVTRTNIDEVVEMLGNAESVIIVPGYGKSYPLVSADVRDGCRQSTICDLRDGPVTQVKGNQLPIRNPPRRRANARTGKSPDHFRFRADAQCNVLLAEAGVPYDGKFSLLVQGLTS